jgi:hypothetical protein
MHVVTFIGSTYLLRGFTSLYCCNFMVMFRVRRRTVANRLGASIGFTFGFAPTYVVLDSGDANTPIASTPEIDLFYKSLRLLASDDRPLLVKFEV